MEGFAGGDEQNAMVGLALKEATGGQPGKKKRSKSDVSGEDVIVLGSGNLGLVYLMDEPRRLTQEEIEERHPELLTALRSSSRRLDPGALAAARPVVLGANGARYLADGSVDGDDPLAAFSRTAAQHLLRTDGFPHVADIMVGSFYDPTLEEGCAFEELICFHGGLGGRRRDHSCCIRRHFQRQARRSSAPLQSTTSWRTGDSIYKEATSTRHRRRRRGPRLPRCCSRLKGVTDVPLACVLR